MEKISNILRDSYPCILKHFHGIFHPSWVENHLFLSIRWFYVTQMIDMTTRVKLQVLTGVEAGEDQANVGTLSSPVFCHFKNKNSFRKIDFAMAISMLSAETLTLKRYACWMNRWQIQIKSKMYCPDAFGEAENINHSLLRNFLSFFSVSPSGTYKTPAPSWI